MADTPHTPPFSNPPPEGHDDGKHVAKLWMALSGASAHDYHDEMPGVEAKSTKVGHEPDKFNAKTIIYVPVAVAITLVVTYLLVQGAFLFVNGKESQQLAETKTTDPAAAARADEENKTRIKPWNERSARTRNWTAEPLAKSTPGDQPLSAAPQPQLEANRQLNFDRLDANNRTVSDPPFLRSFPDQGKNNAPILYPEDLRPENYTDAWHGDAKLLAESAWVKGHEGKLATVAIDEMIHLVAHGEYKGVLKVAEKKAVVNSGTLGRPKVSAGGQTGPVPVAGEKKDDGHGHGK